ncbi:unnamed protein product [Effrenium voratum]|uniref:Uncharacterized protein n=1 Tax=Effrenium voratum TaxID=2562239 RepID=A0AA36IJR9_9DINO|nr:unnamed protein product [Effrenium voratum]CAJ1447360.1 unnamed protein product [Effrenium voratum]
MSLPETFARLPLKEMHSSRSTQSRTLQVSDSHSETSEEQHWIDDAFEHFVQKAGNLAGNVHPSCKKWVSRKLEVYEVPKIARIHAPPLQVPMCCMQTCVTLIAVSWLIVFLHFYEYNVIDNNNVVMQLSFPQSNFEACHDIDVDCDDVGHPHDLMPMEHLAYCNKNYLESRSKKLLKYFFDEKHNYSRSRWPGAPTKSDTVPVKCSKLDIHEVLEDKGAGMQIMTSRTTVKQRKCTADEACLWLNTGIEMDYVYDVERFLLKLQHQIRTEDGRAFQSSHAAGFLLINGSLHSVRCSAAKIKSGACANNMVGFEGSTPCGSTDGTQHPACFSTGFADFFSLDIVLQAAGFSFADELSGGGNLTRRFWGSNVVVDIEWSNSDVWAHWTWPWGLKNRYVVSFRRMSDYAWTTHIRNKPEPNFRDVERHAGLQLQVSLHGKLARFSFLYLLRTLTIFGVLWKVTLRFMDGLMLQMYRNMRCFRHLPPLRMYYCVDNTPHHNQVKEADVYALELHHLKDRQKTLQEMKGDQHSDSSVELERSPRYVAEVAQNRGI